MNCRKDRHVFWLRNVSTHYNMQRLIIIFISISFFSCNKTYPPEYDNGRQILNVNEVGYFGEPLDTLGFVIVKDSISFTNEEAVVKIASASQNYPIKTALLNYPLSENSLIDTTTFKVDENIISYHVEDDTIHIHMTHTLEASIKFHEPIIPITRGPHGVFRYHGSIEFSYLVMTR